MASAFSSALGRILGQARDNPRSRFWRLPIQSAGVTVTWDVFMQFSVAWACVKCIAESISSSEWHVFQTDNGKRIRLENDSLEWLLNVAPNEETSAISAKEVIVAQAASSGNGYAEIQRDNAGRVVALWPMTFDRVNPERFNHDPRERLVYRFLNYDGTQQILEQEDVFHLRGPCSVTSLMGDNVVAKAARSAALSLAAERFSSAFYGNGTEVGTILKSSKPLPKDKLELMRKEWNDWHAGPDRAHRPVILEPGMEIASLASKVGDYDPVKDRKFQLEEILRYFNVPPHKVQHLERATFNNIEHLGLEFTRDTLTPWVKRLEQEAQRKLVPRRQSKITKIDITWLSHGDSLTRATFYEKLLQNAVLSVNEVRKLEGMNTIGPAGDQRVKWSTMTTAEGIQAMVDQTNIENASLLAGRPDPTPTLVDPPPDDTIEGGGDVSARLRAHAQGLIARGQKLLEASTETGVVEGIQAEQMDADGRQVPVGLASVRKDLFDLARAQLTGCLTRYAKRMDNRLADYRKGSKSRKEIAEAMVGERERARPGLLEEMGATMGFVQKYCTRTPSVGDLISAVESIDDGADPSKVAHDLLERATTSGEPAPAPPTDPGIPGGQSR